MDYFMGSGLGMLVGVGVGYISFDYGLNGYGFGGESLVMKGMDNVLDGLK